MIRGLFLLMLALVTPVAFAQVANGYVGSKEAFDRTQYCETRICVEAGTVILSSGLIEEYFNVAPEIRDGSGQVLYTVFFTRRDADGTISRAGLRYDPAQNDTEDGTFALNFFSFVSGVPLQALGKEGLVTGCMMAIRGENDSFFFEPSLRLPFANSAETVLILYRGAAFAESWFKEESSTTRVVKTGSCAGK